MKIRNQGQVVDNWKVSYDTTHFARKKWRTKDCNSCWKSVKRKPTFGINLKTNEKFLKYWSELLLVCYSEKINSINTNLVEIRPFNWRV